MARKTLLNESEIRRFLKLANVGAIGDQRLQQISETEQFKGAKLDEEEEEVEEGLMGAAGELMGQRDEEGEEEADVDMEMGAEEEPMDDMGDDEPEDMAMGDDAGGQMVSVDDFMSALESALEDVMGEPTSVEMSDDEEPLDEPEGMEMEMGPEEEEEEPMDDMGALQEDEIVNEVARRVAARLVNEKKKTAMADNLADRILKRLTK
jgi:hypothetical protein